MRAAGSGDLSSSSLGDNVPGGGGWSLVYLWRWGKHQWWWRTPVIFPGWLARCRRQHNGMVTAKSVARVLCLNEQKLDQCRRLL
jgi:hypothetical protein